MLSLLVNIRHKLTLNNWYTPIVSLKPAPTKHFSLEIQDDGISFDFMMFDEQDSQKEFFKFGQRNLPKELRSVNFHWNAVLDLHNYTKAHAIDTLESFITNSTWCVLANYSWCWSKFRI